MLQDCNDSFRARTCMALDHYESHNGSTQSGYHKVFLINQLTLLETLVNIHVECELNIISTNLVKLCYKF